MTTQQQVIEQGTEESDFFSEDEFSEKHDNQMPAQANQNQVVQHGNSVTPMQLLSIAVSSGADTEKLKDLMALQERWEANQAKKAFDAAISKARAKIKPIVKTAHVSYQGRNGGAATDYFHETLDAIATQIDPILGEFGLSYRYRSKLENAALHVTCIIAHEDGHSEETTLAGSPDTSGSKNNYQAIGSAATYLQRYTLKLALGLSAAKDDDAQSATNQASQDVEYINEEQIGDLMTLINNSGYPLQEFCKIGRVDKLHEIRADRFQAAKNRLLKEIGKFKTEGQQQ